jgi:hypothetical protein
MSTQPIYENENTFNIEVDEQSSQQKIIYDLNKIFHLDFSYNFDLLKNLLCQIIKNQKIKDDKISSLEKRLLGFKEVFDESIGDREIAKKLREAKPKITSLLLKGKEFPDTSCLHNIIRPPPNNIILEPSPKNEPIINQIIVSNNNIL